MLRKLSRVVNMGKNDKNKKKFGVNLGKGGSEHMTEEERGSSGATPKSSFSRFKLLWGRLRGKSSGSSGSSVANEQDALLSAVSSGDDTGFKMMKEEAIKRDNEENRRHMLEMEKKGKKGKWDSSHDEFGSTMPGSEQTHEIIEREHTTSFGDASSPYTGSPGEERYHDGAYDDYPDGEYPPEHDYSGGTEGMHYAHGEDYDSNYDSKHDAHHYDPEFDGSHEGYYDDGYHGSHEAHYDDEYHGSHGTHYDDEYHGSHGTHYDDHDGHYDDHDAHYDDHDGHYDDEYHGSHDGYDSRHDAHFDDPEYEGSPGSHDQYYDDEHKPHEGDEYYDADFPQDEVDWFEKHAAFESEDDFAEYAAYESDDRKERETDWWEEQAQKKFHRKMTKAEFFMAEQEEVQKKLSLIKAQELEASRREEEAHMLQMKADLADKETEEKELVAKKMADEAQRKVDAAHFMLEEAKRREELLHKKEAEIQRYLEEEEKRLAAESEKRLAEAQRLKEELAQKEAELQRQREEKDKQAKKLAEEAKRAAEEAKRAEEAKKRAEEAKKKAEELQKQETALRQAPPEKGVNWEVPQQNEILARETQKRAVELRKKEYALQKLQEQRMKEDEQRRKFVHDARIIIAQVQMKEKELCKKEAEFNKQVAAYKKNMLKEKKREAEAAKRPYADVLSYSEQFRMKQRGIEAGTKEPPLSYYHRPSPCHITAEPEDIAIIIRQRLRKHELVIARREKENELAYMKAKLSHHRLVLHTLNADYRDTAGQCPCCRYYDMKQCVEEFIINYQDRDYEARYYSGNNPLVEVMDEIDNVVSTVRKMTLAANALSAFKMNENELVDNMMEMAEELNNVQRDLLNEERKINKLINRFNKLHEVNFLMRYSALRDMIEEACMDCVTDD